MLSNWRSVAPLALVLLGATACLALLAATDVGATSGASRVGTQAQVRVGTTLELAPNSFVNNRGRPVGFEIDLMNAMAKRLDMTPKYVKTPFEQMFTGLAARKFDVAAASMFLTCKRLKDPNTSFGVPLYTTGLVLTWKGGDEPTPQLKDLSGKTLGVESVGTTPYLVAEEHKSEFGYEVETFDNNNDLLLALVQGRVDAVLQSVDVMGYATRNRTDVKVGPILKETSVGSAFLFRTVDKALRLRFNNATNSLKRNGTTRKIYRKWFGVAPEPSNPIVKVVPETTMKTCAK